jgi:hypothetical protein
VAVAVIVEQAQQGLLAGFRQGWLVWLPVDLPPEAGHLR